MDTQERIDSLGSLNVNRISPYHSFSFQLTVDGFSSTDLIDFSHEKFSKDGQGKTEAIIATEIFDKFGRMTLIFVSLLKVPCRFNESFGQNQPPFVHLSFRIYAHYWFMTSLSVELVFGVLLPDGWNLIAGQSNLDDVVSSHVETLKRSSATSNGQQVFLQAVRQKDRDGDITSLRQLCDKSMRRTETLLESHSFCEIFFAGEDSDAIEKKWVFGMKSKNTFWTSFSLSELSSRKNHLVLVEKVANARVFDIGVAVDVQGRTKKFTFGARIILVNKLSHKIELKQFGTAQQELVEPHTHKPIHRLDSSQPCNFTWRIAHDGWKWTCPLKFDEVNHGNFIFRICNQLLSTSKIVNLRVQKKRETFIVDLSEQISGFPYRIENFSKFGLVLSQDFAGSFVETIPPYDIGSFAWENPFSTRKVSLSISSPFFRNVCTLSLDSVNESFVVNLGRDEGVVDAVSLKIFILKDQATTVLKVVDMLNDIDRKVSTRATHSRVFSQIRMSIPSIAVSLFGEMKSKMSPSDLFRELPLGELCLIRVVQLDFVSSWSDHAVDAMLLIQNVQLTICSPILVSGQFFMAIIPIALKSS
eukprot:TRINITY_DN17204_c0_g1_i2.p1 TRINITY_DN17204_c0_g1~~TRINITY_DN17204_c0_g1_i2.p1  ORF type:complete len:601 (-),score=110.17 TRINITY_DN17204_c0_g1_i2:1081-2838(-)